MGTATRVGLNLVDLHHNQSQIATSRARYRVAACGRRFGKTEMAKGIIINRALRGQRCWWLSPVYSQSTDFWHELEGLLGDWCNIITGERNIYFPTGGYIGVRSAHNPDTLRGFGLDFAVLDEAAFMRPEVWSKVIRPMLLERRGSGLFLSTPYGLNWFWDIFLLGQDGTEPDWESWKFTSYDNPIISRDELESIKRTTPGRTFEEEYLANFHSSGGGVFDASLITFIDDCPEYIEGHIYVAGIDWGQDNDFTALSISDRTANRQVFIGRWRKMPWSAMRKEIIRALLKFRVTMVRPERNSMGSSQIESLWSEIEDAELECELMPFTMGGKNKHELITFYRTGLEDHGYALLDDDAQKREHITYETKRTTTGMYSYSAPSGGHDDTVIAGALSYIAMMSIE